MYRITRLAFCLFALVFLVDAFAIFKAYQPVTSGFAFPSTFQGNPNPNITAIDTSGGIVASRTSCQTPCFVHVSGSAITATGTSKPYEDLEYSWDFGDPSGTETFTNWYTNNGTTGTTVNANAAQTGPEAVYVYRTSGTKTVTVGVRGKNGAGFTTATKTLAITVTTFAASADMYFDSAAAGGGDGSIGTPFNDIANLNTQLGIDGRAIHIKKGSSWSGSTGLVVNGGVNINSLRMDTYGTGAAPSFTIVGGGGLDYSLSIQGSSAKKDIVISGPMNFTVTSSTVGGDGQIKIQTGSTAGNTSDIYLDNLTLVSNTNQLGGIIFMTFTNLGDTVRGGLWNVSASWSVAQSGNLVFPLPSEWGFVVGGTFQGNGLDPVHDQIIYPNTRHHSLYRYINFGASTGKAYNINTNTFPDANDATGVGEYVLMSNNNMNSTVNAWDASNADSTPIVANGYFQNFVSQFNLVHDFSGTPGYWQGVRSMTVRWNNFWNNAGAFGQQLMPVNAGVFGTQMSIYSNKIYYPGDGGDQNSVFELDGVGVSANALQYVTDNIVQMQATVNTNNAIQGDFSKYQANSSVIDRNSWYQTGQTGTSIYFNGTTGTGVPISQATMQGTYGFETNSTITNTANPSWSNPSSGVFQ